MSRVYAEENTRQLSIVSTYHPPDRYGLTSGEMVLPRVVDRIEDVIGTPMPQKGFTKEEPYTPFHICEVCGYLLTHMKELGEIWIQGGDYTICAVYTPTEDGKFELTSFLPMPALREGYVRELHLSTAYGWYRLPDGSMSQERGESYESIEALVPFLLEHFALDSHDRSVNIMDEFGHYHEEIRYTDHSGLICPKILAGHLQSLRWQRGDILLHRGTQDLYRFIGLGKRSPNHYSDRRIVATPLGSKEGFKSGELERHLLRRIFEPDDKRITVNEEDGKLRLYTRERLEDWQWQKLKDAQFKYVRGGNIFYAVYTPWRHELLTEMFDLVTLELDDTDLDEIANTRAERYSTLAENAQRSSDKHRDRAKQIQDAIPFGQPILVGHHSEGRDRRLRKTAFNAEGKRGAEEKRARKWAGRASAALGTRERKKQFTATENRLKTYQAALRKVERERKRETLELHRYREYYGLRIAFEEALLETFPKPTSSALTRAEVEVGGAVVHVDSHPEQTEWFIITRILRTNVEYELWQGFKCKYPIAGILPAFYMTEAQVTDALATGLGRIEGRSNLMIMPKGRKE